MGKLNLQLPPARWGEYYQLAHLGTIGKQSKDSENVDVIAYFHKKHERDNFEQIIGEPIERRVHLHQIRELQVGSLWDVEGRRVMDSVEVIPSTAYLTLGAEAKRVITLKDLLPGYTFIKNTFSQQLWPQIESTFYAIIETDGIQIAVPCIEIIKYFFYRGARTIDFLFSRQAIGTICQAVTLPTQSNDFAVKVIVHNNKLKGDEIRILTELIINESFRRNVYSSHTKLTAYWNLLYEKKASDPRGCFINDGLIGRDVILKVNGIPLLYQSRSGSREIFLVSSILSCQTNFFSYKHLEFDYSTGGSKGASAQNKEAESEDERRNRIYIDNEEKTIDSNERGDSRYSNNELEIKFEDGFKYPSVRRNGAVAEEAVRKGVMNPQTRSPTVLSERGGGSDPDKARVSISYPPEEVKLLDEFKAIARQLGEKEEFKVQLLEVNNRYRKYGTDVSVFPHWQKKKHPFYFTDAGINPRRVGIIQVAYRSCYFYLLQVGRSGRESPFKTALLCKTARSKWSEADINALLERVAIHQGNWSVVWRNYNNNNKERQYLDRKLGSSLKFERMVHDKESVDEYVDKYSLKIKQLRKE